MAPAKRSAPVASAAAAKKGKINPAFAEIQDTLKKAEHLPANCRAMLAAMAPMSFTTAREERSEQQVTVIQWLENALLTQQGKLVAETEDAAGVVSKLEARRMEKLPEVQRAEALLNEKKEQLVKGKNALAEATIAMTATKKKLAEKQEEQRVCDADYLAMKKEQDGLASAFVDHFKAPLEAGEALHYEQLQPFLTNLDLEESFVVSVPDTCAKTKEQRGSFDNVVLQALEQALLDRAGQIKDVVSNRSPESLAREAGVCEAEEQLAKDRTAQEKAAAGVAAAQKDVELASSALKEIEKAFAVFEAELKATTDLRSKLQSVQDQFEQGPLSSFRTSKEGAAATELCATAGA